MNRLRLVLAWQARDPPSSKLWRGRPVTNGRGYHRAAGPNRQRVRGTFAEITFMTRHSGVPAKAIHPNVRMGHVHLKVADLERALGFYRDVLGFELTQRFGSSAAFLSAGGYHHHIGLNTWESDGGQPPASGTTGLITWPFFIRRGQNWVTPCGACRRQAFRSKELRIMA